MKRYGLLAILIFFSSSIHAANCIPKVFDKKVTVEFFDGDGNLVSSETHKVRSKKKYKGLVSNEDALKKLVKDTSGNIKIGSSKLDIKSGGMTTKISKRDGTSLAKIGGCPVSKLKFYKRIGKQKSPFIHKSLIEAASKAEVQATTAAKSNPASADIRQSDREKRRLASAEAASAATSTQAVAQPARQAAIQPATNTNTKSGVSVKQGPAGTPWKTVSEPINDVYGWVVHPQIRVYSSYAGKNKGSHYQTIETAAQGTFSLSGQKSSCMHLYYEHGIPVQSRETVANEKMDAESKKIESLSGEFVKLNGLRLVESPLGSGFISKGQECTFSSISKGEYPPKTSAYFTLKGNVGEYLRSYVARDSGRFTFPRGIWYHYNDPEASTLRFEKAHLYCGGSVAWSSSKNFKAMKKRVESGEFDNINAAEIELQGMAQSTYQQMMCEVDNVKVKKLN